MAEIQRGLVQMLIDLDRRARPGRESRYRAIQKFVGLLDTVQVSSETVTATVNTGAYQWTLQSYRAAVMADAPTAYWRLGETAPAVTANDEMGTYYGTVGVGTLFGATAPGPSEPNGAARFNQSSGIVSIPHSTNLNTSSSGGFSVECWVFTSSSGVTEQKIVAKINAALTRYWFISQASTLPSPGFAFTPNNATDMIGYSPAVFPVNAWTHLVGTWDGASTAALYYNGLRVATATATSGTDSTGAVTIGGTTTIGQLLSGAVDEVAIYKSALSSDRVLAHYNAMVNPSSSGLTNKWVWGQSQYKGMRLRTEVLKDSPLAYWRLGEMAPAVTANDESTNRRGGTYSASGVQIGRRGGITADIDTCAYTTGSTGIALVTHTTALNPTPEITLEAWVNPSFLGTATGSTDACTIIEKRVVAVSSSGYKLRIRGNGLVDFYDSTGVISSVGAITTGTWNHIAALGTVNGLRLYINGALDGTNAIAYTGSNTTRALMIGGSSVVSEQFNGFVDEVAVYGSALTTARLYEHYLAGTVSS